MAVELQRIIAAAPAATSRAIHRTQGLADETLVLYEMADGAADLAHCHKELEKVSEEEAVQVFRAMSMVL